jgi:hypothetical protein
MANETEEDAGLYKTTVGVVMTVAEREEIRAEAKRRGLKMATFIRTRSLEAARERSD